MHAVVSFIFLALSSSYASCADPGYGVLPHLNALHQVHMGGLFLELQDWQAAFHTQPGIQKLSKYYDNLAGFRSQAPPHFPPSVTDPVGTNHEIRLHKVQNVDPACAEKKNHYYRSLDGKCNWIANASYGVAGKGFDRARPSQYADGYNAPRKAPTPHATPRNLSNAFFDPSKKGPIKNWQHSSWLSALVEFVIGDLFGPTPSTDPEDTYPIPIPKGDPDFDPEGTGNKSMWFTRHAKVPGTGVPGKPREILNTRTPWFDLDPIYGINENDNRLLRTLVDGKMKLSADGQHLPLLTELGGDLSFKMFGKDPANLFASGDPRANRDAFLVTFITVFVKEHNRLCDVLMKRYPNGLSDGPWTDELLFLTARSMLSIKYQTIAMNYFESYFIDTPSFQYGGMGFNPFIFIQETNEMSQVKVNPYLTYPPDIYWGQHGTPDPLAPPNVPLIETDIAYRYHDIVPSVVPLVCEGGFRCGEHSITHASYKADVVKQYGLNNIIRGMATNALPDFGTGLNAELRSVKFDLGNPAIKNKFDLAAWSIERERSNGVPTWNEFFGKNVEGKNLWNGKAPYDIGPKINWEDFSNDPEMIEQLQFFYEHPDQVDMAVAMELEAERWPATALPKSVFAANILGLINQGLIDRFSLSVAQSRCLVEDKPWDCHPSNIVEELLWPYVPEFGLRWYDQFWLDEFDINNDGAQTLWNIIVKNTDVKCLPLNPLFMESPTNPIMCYNVTAFPTPDPREFLVLTTPKGQTAALWNNLSTYGDAVYYRFPPIEAGNTPLPVSHNILISTKELFKQTIVDSTAWGHRPQVPLFEYLYSATMNKHVYGEEPKRQYAVVNNFGPNWAKLSYVLDQFHNPSIVGWLPIFNVVHMNYLKYGWLNDLANGSPAGIDLPVAIRTYQTMVSGQMALGFQFYVNTSKSLTEIIDKSHMTTWVTLFMTAMDYNLPGMAWPPSVNYTNDQRMESFAHLVRTVWKEDESPLNLDYIADFLSSLGIAISDADMSQFHKYVKLTKPTLLHFKDHGVDLETVIPVMIDVIAGNMISSQYMEHALWRLSCMPDLQEKIYQAVKGHTMDFHFLATNPGAQLIMKFVKEMTRYMPLGAGIGARLSSQRTTLDGKLVEKSGDGSTTLMYNGGRIGRDPKNFKNPNVFDIDRWSMQSGEDGLWEFIYDTANYSVIEFGVGERKCPGTFTAFVGIAHFIGEMIKTYKFEKISEEKCKVDPVPMLSPFGQWFVPGDLDVKFKIRQEEKFEIKFDFNVRFKDTVKYLENLGQKVWDGLVGHPKKSPLKHQKK